MNILKVYSYADRFETGNKVSQIFIKRKKTRQYKADKFIDELK